MLVNESNRKWWVLVGVSIASFLGCLDFTIVNTALPAIQIDLNATVTALQWIINIFILALSTCMVIMGRLADIYGRRKVLYIGMIIFGLSSLGAGIAPSIDWLIIFRLIQGISCAILYAASGAIVANAFPVHERGKAIGSLFGVNGIGLAIGPVFGGILVSALSWRWIFLINVPLILVSLLICYVSVRESFNREHGTVIDWFGLCTLLISLPCFVLVITQGSEWGWTSKLTISLFIFSLLMFITFYKIEMHHTNPIIQFHLFANRLFITSVIATFSLALFYCLAFFLMPLYLHNMRDLDGYMIGLMLLPTTAMVAILSPVVGKIVDNIGPKMPLLIGFFFLVISALLQANLMSGSSSMYILVAFACMGIGWGFILGPSSVASLSAVPESMGAVAMGTSWTLHNIGGAVGLGIGVLVYRMFAKDQLVASLAQYSVGSDVWIDRVIANPDLAIQLLSQHISMKSTDILAIFQHFFMTGYHAAMWLLFGVTLLTFVVLLFCMQKKTN